MKAVISKEFTFEAAHHLPNHDGKCRNPHGHSYKVVVSMRGDVARGHGPKEGMVIDFADVKGVWKEHIEPHLDHKDLNEKFLFPTTAENLATWLLLEFRAYSIPVCMVELYETETSCVVVDADDLDEETVSFLRSLEATPA